MSEHFSTSQYDESQYDYSPFNFGLKHLNLLLREERTNNEELYPSIPFRCDPEGRINIADAGNFFCLNEGLIPMQSCFFYLEVKEKNFVYAYKLTQIRDVWVKTEDVVKESMENRSLAHIIIKYRQMMNSSPSFDFQPQVLPSFNLNSTPSVEIQPQAFPPYQMNSFSLFEFQPQSKPNTQMASLNMIEFNPQILPTLNAESCLIEMKDYEDSTEEQSSKTEKEFSSTAKINQHSSKKIKKMHFEECSEKKTGKRIKERTIQEAKDLVTRWRHIYDGYLDPQTQRVVKPTLEEAAIRLGISKRTLEDYRLMLKHGEELGFAFDRHMNMGVGLLRGFLRDWKKGNHVF